MSKGILLIAIGSNYYGKMAVNLAATIKATDKNCPIHLAYTDDAIMGLTKEKLRLFDSMEQCPEDAFMTDGKEEFIKVKTWMYELSPFKQTLFLDVDLAWMRTISPLSMIDKLDEAVGKQGWTIQNTGKEGRSVWCDIAEVRVKYGAKEFWNYHSEFVYFRKCRSANTYFKRVKKKYTDPGLEKMTRFGGASMADELAFQLASIETGQYPHKDWYVPIFWFARDKQKASKRSYELKKEHQGYSVGGNKTPAFVRQEYDKIVAASFARLGMRYPFKLKDKVYFIPSRKNI